MFLLLLIALLRIDEVANRLALKSSTIRAWRLRRKNLDFVTCGRAVRVTQESVERFIRANTIPAREVKQ